MLLACSPTPPSLEDSLYLYREGRINEARMGMAAYIRAKPYNPESEEARQHIILIRRIKQLESIAIEQWCRGNHRGAAKIVGIMRVLHPVYVDSADIYRFIDFSQPPKWISAPAYTLEPAPIDPADTTTQQIIPYTLAVLDYQVEAIAYLAEEWEVGKYTNSADPVSYLAASLMQPEMLELLGAIDTAYQALHRATIRPDPLVVEIDLLADQFHQFLAFIRSDTLPPMLSFEYSFHGYKRDLLLQILNMKSRLGSIPEPVERADTSLGSPATQPGS